MGVRLTSQESVVALFDSVSGWAFGPVFDDEEQAESFLAFLAEDRPEDARTLSVGQLDAVYGRWCDAMRAATDAEQERYDIDHGQDGSLRLVPRHVHHLEHELRLAHRRAERDEP